MQEESPDALIHTVRAPPPALPTLDLALLTLPNLVPSPIIARMSQPSSSSSSSSSEKKQHHKTVQEVQLADLKEGSPSPSPQRSAVVTDSMWKSSCREWNPKLLLFMAQVWFSSFLVILSVYMIVKQGTEASPNALWVSILTSTATLWLPSPQLQRHPVPSKD